MSSTETFRNSIESASSVGLKCFHLSLRHFNFELLTTVLLLTGISVLSTGTILLLPTPHYFGLVLFSLVYQILIFGLWVGVAMSGTGPGEGYIRIMHGVFVAYAMVMTIPGMPLVMERFLPHRIVGTACCILIVPQILLFLLFITPRNSRLRALLLFGYRRRTHASVAMESQLTVAPSSDMMSNFLLKGPEYNFQSKGLALYTYVPRDTKGDELAFVRGETLEVTVVPGRNWWWAERPFGKAGWVPSNYISLLKDCEVDSVTAFPGYGVVDSADKVLREQARG